MRRRSIVQSEGAAAHVEWRSSRGQWIDVVHFDIVNSITLAQLPGSMAKSYVGRPAGCVLLKKDGPLAMQERVNPLEDEFRLILNFTPGWIPTQIFNIFREVLLLYFPWFELNEGSGKGLACKEINRQTVEALKRKINELMSTRPLRQESQLGFGRRRGPRYFWLNKCRPVFGNDIQRGHSYINSKWWCYYNLTQRRQDPEGYPGK